MVIVRALADHGTTGTTETTVQLQSVYSTCVHTTGCTTQSEIDKENLHKHVAMKTTPKILETAQKTVQIISSIAI